MGSDSVLSVLSAFRNHPSIKNIKKKKFNSTFSFENTDADVVMKVINNLNVAKICQINDKPTKVSKWIKIFLLMSLRITSITVLLIVKFPNELNMLMLFPSTKRMKSVARQITDQWAFWLTFQKFMRNYCITSYPNTLTVY